MDQSILGDLIVAVATIVAALIGLMAVLMGRPSATPGDRPSPVERPPRAPWRLRSRLAWLRTAVRRRKAVGVTLATVIVVALAYIVYVVFSQSAGCHRLVPLTVTSSTEKDTLITELVADYKARGEAHNGVCAEVAVSPVSSGDAMAALVDVWGATEYTQGKPKPDVWLPTSSMWVRQYELLKNTSVAHSPITRSQLIIAMPKTIAEAVNWPAKLRWRDLRSLVTSPEPWRLHPKLPKQPFVIRKDNPKYSTSGLASTVAAYYAGNRELHASTNLLSAVGDEAVVNYVRSLESGVEYTHDVMDLLTELGRRDAQGASLKYLSGIVMQEQLVYLYNSRDPEVFGSGKPASLNEPLYVFYPDDGLLELDHPYVVLSTDPTVRDAAESFRKFLLAGEQQQRFMARGFRDVRTNELAPATRSVMNIPSGPLPAHTEKPDAQALVRILQDIDLLRRKARVLLVLDVSGSMRDQVGDTKPKAELVRDAVKAALNQLNPNDEVGLITFANGHAVNVGVAPFTTAKDDLIAALDNLQLGGGTALYDTVRAATEMIARPREFDWVNSVVVLTDGEDTGYPGEQAEAQALALLAADLSQREHKVPVYTIGFGLNTSPDSRCEPVAGEDPVLRDAREALKTISDASGGKCFNAAATGPSYINKVFVDVFRHF